MTSGPLISMTNGCVLALHCILVLSLFQAAFYGQRSGTPTITHNLSFHTTLNWLSFLDVSVSILILFVNTDWHHRYPHDHSE